MLHGTGCGDRHLDGLTDRLHNQISREMVCCALPYRLMETAKEMTRESLPIKCLEAVILGMYP